MNSLQQCLLAILMTVLTCSLKAQFVSRVNTNTLMDTSLSAMRSNEKKHAGYYSELRDTNGPVSYYQQLRELEKLQIQEFINEKMILKKPTRDREVKQIDEEQKLAALKLQVQQDEEKKQELELQEEKKQLQQQIVLRYIKNLHKQSAEQARTPTPNYESEPNPTPTPERRAIPVQEALKAEPPHP